MGNYTASAGLKTEKLTVFLGTYWMVDVSAHITDVFAVEILYECAHCNLTHGKLGK